MKEWSVKQDGRPILIVLTEKEENKNYLLVNLHAPNRQPGNDVRQMEITAFCIETHIKRALKKFGIDSSVILDKTFIMGDFNGYFPKDSPFTIEDMQLRLIREPVKNIK